MIDAVHRGLADALARLAAQRDADAWAVVLEQVGPRVATLARRITGDSALSDDVVQETLLRVRDSAHQFRPHGDDADRSARHWIMRIAVNVAYQLLRQDRSRHRRETRAGSGRPVAVEHDPAFRLERNEQDDQVRLALAALPEKLRSAIVLRHLFGAGIPAIADELGIPEGTAKVRIHRGIARLRETLGSRGIVCSALVLAGLVEQLPAAAPGQILTGTLARDLLTSPLAPALSPAVALPAAATLSLTAKLAIACLAVAAIGVGAALPVWSPPPAPPAPAASAVTAALPLFDGSDLSGWDLEPGFWQVRDGAISGVGQGSGRPHFCIWRGGEVEDFELTVDFRLSVGNSGIGFRDQDLGNHDVIGYQVDLGSGHTGDLFEQNGRGLIAACGEDVEIGADATRRVKSLGSRDQLLASVKDGTWVTCRIVARGERVSAELNGARVSAVTDHEACKRRRSGVIALEMWSQGPGFDGQFRNLRLKRLPVAGTP